jgi:predicted MFS family arabinose efflux permease
MLGQALSGVGLAMSAAVISLQHPVGLALTLALVGIGLGVFQVGYQDATLDAVPADNRGLAGALINVTRLSGIVLGAFSLGAIGERWGAVGALAVSAFALALWAGCLAALLRRGKSVYRDRS